jgi:hypothetical protein
VRETMTICSIKKKEILFHTNFIFQVDHRDGSSRGVGCTSDETFSLIQEKINECEKGCFLLNMEGVFLVHFSVTTIYNFYSAVIGTIRKNIFTHNY